MLSRSLARSLARLHAALLDDHEDDEDVADDAEHEDDEIEEDDEAADPRLVDQVLKRKWRDRWSCLSSFFVAAKNFHYMYREVKNGWYMVG